MRQLLLAFAILLGFGGSAHGEELLRIFTWQGYVTQDDLDKVNRTLRDNHLNVRAVLVRPYAEGPEQMFQLMRQNRADVSFLTVNYIQMQDGRIGRLLQGIDTSRLRNADHIIPALANLPMGRDGQQLLYVPFGGGAYGIWANMRKLRDEELPRRLHDLLLPRWRHRLSLTIGQVQPNVALAYMAEGQPPFLLDQLVRADQREAAKQQLIDSRAKRFLDKLYGQVREFWTDTPSFSDEDLLVANYGPEMAARRAKGEQWKMVNFVEGNTVWLDTMNILKGVNGDKLTAAYLFIDHMLSAPVQRRVVEGLGMVAVTRDVNNPLLKENPDFFRATHFWPPYTTLSDNLMRAMSEEALRAHKPLPKPDERR
jgi:spermidine/putrescine-binding protein